MKWQQFLLSTSEFDKRFSNILRFKISEGEDVLAYLDDHQCPEYFSEIDIRGKKENVKVFNTALHYMVSDKMMHDRFQRFMTSVCYRFDIPLIQLNDLVDCNIPQEEQAILLLSLIYFMS